MHRAPFKFSAALVIALSIISCTDEGTRTGLTDFRVGLPYYCINDTYDFGSQPVGSTYTVPFTVLNVGNGDAALVSASVDSPFRFAGGSFPGTNGTCSGTLASQATCLMVLEFSPTDYTTYSQAATLTYQTMGATRNVSCTFSGRGKRESGSLDTSFHTDGIFTTFFNTTADAAIGMAVQADGKPVVVGSANVAGSDDVGVLRLDTTGALDTSFHTDGKVTTASTDSGVAVVFSTDSKIIVAVNVTAGGFGVVRYNTGGSMDTSFHTDGLVATTFDPAGGHTPKRVFNQSNDRIVLVGTADIGAQSYYAAVRYLTSGILDTSFHTDGKLTVTISNVADTLSGGALLSDGRIFLGGDADTSQGVARLSTDGALDTSFHTDGKAVATFYPTWEPGGMTVGTDGHVTVGYTWPDPDSVYYYGLTRLRSDGTLDTSFHTDGALVQSITTAAAIAVDMLGIQTDGQAILGGTFPVAPNFQFAMVRWGSSGVLDTSFGTAGVTTTSLGAADFIYGDVALYEGKIYRSGRHAPHPGTNSQFGILRYWQ